MGEFFQKYYKVILEPKNLKNSKMNPPIIKHGRDYTLFFYKKLVCKELGLKWLKY